VTPDAELVVLLAGLHILGFAFAAVLFAVLIRSDNASSWSSDDEDDGGGGNDRPARPRPEGPHGGGLPLPDAVPAAMRLRGHERLADTHPRPPRRAPREPAPQPRIPAGP
jgi:hypothetical protein